MNLEHRIGVAIFACLVLVCGCTTPEPPTEGYIAEIDAYRAARVESLKRPDSWLTLIGLHWLEPGVTRFGSAGGLEIVLPEDAAPKIAGRFKFVGEAVTLFVEPGVEMTFEDQPLQAWRYVPDAGQDSGLLRLGRLSLQIIQRDGRFAVRIKDPQSDVRSTFEGLDFFEIDPRFRVKARFKPFDEPQARQIATVVGTTAEMFAPGQMEFELDGRTHTLEPLVGRPGETDFAIYFKDSTSGVQTYGAARYLSAELVGDEVEVDFNKAYNPPCAFTPYATCPLPPPGNRLEVAILAGEKAYAHH